MQASVPVETKRTFPASGTRARTKLGELGLGQGRRAEGEPTRCGGLDNSDDLRVGVPEDCGTPRSDEVDVLAPGHVPHQGALGAGDEDGCPSDGAVRPHGRGDPRQG